MLDDQSTADAGVAKVTSLAHEARRKRSKRRSAGAQVTRVEARGLPNAASALMRPGAAARFCFGG